MTNDKKYKFCKQCGNRFEYIRSDAVFCSGACVAMWYRKNPNPDYIHAEMPHIHQYYCEECAAPFEVNGYANRGGKRRPKYCSVKCKQKAYRGRVSQQAARRQKQQGGASQQNDSTSQGQPKDNSWSTKRFTFAQACHILGVAIDAPLSQIKVEYRRLCKKWHPDVNPAERLEECTEMMKMLNRAYDLAMKHYKA